MNPNLPMSYRILSIDIYIEFNRYQMLPSPKKLLFEPTTPPRTKRRKHYPLHIKEGLPTVVLHISAHGLDGVVNTSTNQGFDRIEENVGYPDSYLEEVHIAIAVGETGICSFMDEHAAPPYEDYSTSEVDFLKIYETYEKAEEENKTMNQTFADARLHLREYVKEERKKKPVIKPEGEKQEVVDDYLENERLIENNKLWIHGRVNRDTIDRRYSFYPSSGESTDYRVHYGLHVVDIKNHPLQGGINRFENGWRTDENNLLANSSMRAKWMAFLEQKSASNNPAVHNAAEELKTFMNTYVSPSKEKPVLLLSDILFLCFSFGFKQVLLFDPSCREGRDIIERATRRGIYSKKTQRLPIHVLKRLQKSSNAALISTMSSPYSLDSPIKSKNITKRKRSRSRSPGSTQRKGRSSNSTQRKRRPLFSNSI